MSDVKFSPFVPNGTVNVPPSKSDVHRAIICAAMANGVSRISPVALSNDIKATIGCIKALGADAVLENNVLTVDGTNMYKNKTALLDCGESGSTLRFLFRLPLSAILTQHLWAKANFHSALSEYLQRLCQRRVPSAKQREDFPLKSKVS